MRAGVVGEGIMGQLLAFALINAGWDVTLFGSGEKDTCSMAAAGLLTPVAELEKNDRIIYQMGRDAINQHWPTILRQLKTEIYFKKQGSLVISHPRDKTDLQRFIKIISDKLKNKSDCQAVNNGEIYSLEPALSHFEEGYFFPEEAQIDNQALLIEIKNYLDEKNITRINHAWVSDIQPGKIMLNNKTHHFDWVFDCRGMGAKKSFPDLRSVRGELIWLQAPDVTIKRPIRFLHPRYGLYIVPRPNNIYLIGASEIESPDDGALSVRTALELLSAAYSVHPNFSAAKIIKLVTQCRPTLPNHLPKIKYSDHYLAINGLYRHGFLIAPTLVFEIIRWLTEGVTSICYKSIWEATHDFSSLA